MFCLTFLFDFKSSETSAKIYGSLVPILPKVLPFLYLNFQHWNSECRINFKDYILNRYFIVCWEL